MCIIFNRGYAPVEYAIHGRLSEKVDIYSYGVVVLEIISGQQCNKLKIDSDEGEYLLQKVRKISMIYLIRQPFLV